MNEALGIKNAVKTVFTSNFCIFTFRAIQTLFLDKQSSFLKLEGELGELFGIKECKYNMLVTEIK
jgi:hypothetical protein